MNRPSPNTDFETLLEYLHRSRGFDFTAYKRPSLMRRFQKRMDDLKIDSYGDYQDYLEVHPDEFVHLFNTILINVTSFFRDPGAWEYIANEIIPQVLESKGPTGPIRVWTAGCATGEEAYTLAVLFAEALGPHEFRNRVKIYATDVSETALARGRSGAYTAREVEGIPKDLLAKYFREQGNSYIFDLECRRCVIFGRHDLIQDSPISKIDLLVCRNTLMYFNSEVQARILSRFNFALNPGGLLFLGKAEMLLNHSDVFIPVDLKRRVFRKVARNGGPAPAVHLSEGEPVPVTRLVPEGELRSAALLAEPIPQVLVDLAGTVVLINDQARALFGLTTREVGRPLQDLTLSYRPVELRARIEQAFAERRAVHVKDVEWHGLSPEHRTFDVSIMPLCDSCGNLIGASVSYVETTPFKKLREELRLSQQERETAQEELQTTNEELQSTVEELETTNEELQSTNEELETMNEELQSTNEELRTSNEELRQRGEEIDRFTGFWESVVGGIRAGLVVLDRDFRVEVWNRHSEDLWGLRAEEVLGRHFLSLDIGLPVSDLKGPINSCLTKDPVESTHDFRAVNRRGQHIHVKVTATPLVRQDLVRGVILLVEDGRPNNGP